MYKNDILQRFTSPWDSLNTRGNDNGWLDPFDVFDINLGTFLENFPNLQPKMNNFPKINVSETEDNYEVEISISGYSKDDVLLEFKDDNSLVVDMDTKRTESKPCKNKKYLIREIAQRRQARRIIKFPVEVDTSNIKSGYADGVITCTLPKQVLQKKESTVKINIE